MQMLNFYGLFFILYTIFKKTIQFLKYDPFSSGERHQPKRPLMSFCHAPYIPPPYNALYNTMTVKDDYCSSSYVDTWDVSYAFKYQKPSTCIWLRVGFSHVSI